MLQLSGSTLKRQEKSFAHDSSCIMERAQAISIPPRQLIFELLMTKTVADVAAQVPQLWPQKPVNVSVVRKLAQSQRTAYRAHADTQRKLLKTVHNTPKI